MMAILLETVFISECQRGFLSEVHSAGDAQRVEHDVDWRSVFEVRHILDGDNLRDDALVSVVRRTIRGDGDAQDDGVGI